MPYAEWAFLLSTKFQAPKPKQIAMTKIRNSKQNRFGDLGIDPWSLFGIWNCHLGFLYLTASSLFLAMSACSDWG